MYVRGYLNELNQTSPSSMDEDHTQDNVKAYIPPVQSFVKISACYKELSNKITDLQSVIE